MKETLGWNQLITRRSITWRTPLVRVMSRTKIQAPPTPKHWPLFKSWLTLNKDWLPLLNVGNRSPSISPDTNHVPRTTWRLTTSKNREKTLKFELILFHFSYLSIGMESIWLVKHSIPGCQLGKMPSDLCHHTLLCFKSLSKTIKMSILVSVNKSGSWSTRFCKRVNAVCRAGVHLTVE